MTPGAVIAGAASITVAYLLGSIPSAYIVTRVRTGKDIRNLGGGNVGARNTFREVGRGSGIAVGILDVAKGAGAVAVAQWGLRAPQALVVAAGIAVVAGHIWPIYLRFKGGNGLATTLGVLAVLMHWELLIVLVLTIILIPLTHNTILSVNLSLLTVPVSLWFIEKPEARVWLFLFSMALLVIMVVHFSHNIVSDFTRAGNMRDFVAELLRRKKTGKTRTPS